MWVRLEARPFHIPSRIALLGWSVMVNELCGRLGTSVYGRAAAPSRGDGFCGDFVI